MEVKTPEQLAAELKSLQEANVKANNEIVELKKQAEEAKGNKEDIAKLKTEIESKQALLDALEEKMNNLSVQEKATAEELFTAELKTAMATPEFKGGNVVEVKADTTTLVMPTYNSQVLPGVNVERRRVLAFLPYFSLHTVPQDKDVIVYIDATYNSVVGYVGEGASVTGDGTVSASEKKRELAKISAKITVTREMFEDANNVSQRIIAEMQRAIELWIDNELYLGEGDDTTNKNKVYGLKAQATAFDATKAGVSGTVQDPTLTDLMDCVALQGSVIDVADATKKDKGGYNINTFFVNPVDFNIWKHKKDANNNYLYPFLSDAMPVMGGYNIVKTTAVPKGQLLAMETGLNELHVKRALEIRRGTVNADLIQDKETIVAFMRLQTLIKTFDKYGVIKVDDITAALTAIEIAEPAPEQP